MKPGKGALAALERRVGYQFTNRDLLVTALTHASARSRAPARDDYERLEFLGDRVLGLVIAEMLLEAFPEASEGELSSSLASLVRKETCAEVAGALDLGLALITGGGKAHRRGLLTRNVLGDACEAVIAAIYLDGGIEAARRFIGDNWGERMAGARRPGQDAKTALQEWAQAKGMATPKYVITERRGPDHDSVFAVEVRLDSVRPGRGEGRTRRDAEQEAAQAVLVREGVRKDAW
jgi:ribonuclease-3